MHESIRNRLEDLLTARGAAVEEDLAKHLSGCRKCSAKIEAMRSQAELLQTLRAEEVEPAPGFYARVLQRIEARAKDSIWAVFLYSPFGKRLAYVSLTVAVTLGTYIITQESLDGHLGGDRSTLAQTVYDHPLVAGSQDEQRDAVLANFASHPVVSTDSSRQGLVQ